MTTKNDFNDANGSFSVGEFTVKYWFETDYDISPLDYCLLGSVSTARYKKSSEMILKKHGRDIYVYAFAEAVAKARKKGLCGEKAHDAAMREFNWLRGWYNDLWCYVFVKVEVYDRDGELIEEDCCGGVESDSCKEFASEMANDILKRLVIKLKQ